MKFIYCLTGGLLAVAALCSGLSCRNGPAHKRTEISTGALGVYDVGAYGAVGDGKNIDSPAIDAAINACAKAGGGTVLVPAGIYLCGSIHLQSNINLCLDTGATVMGAAQDSNSYDAPELFPGTPYQDIGHSRFHNSLIWGENLTNVSITGRGTINGGGLAHSTGSSGDDFTPSPNANKSIALKSCRNVLIRDVTIAHGGWFAILTTGCDLLTIDNVTIDTNRDGMDLDCCRNVAVSNCRVNSPNDDAICPKSTLALGKRVITENMTITNCQVSGYEEGTLLDGTLKPGKNRNGRIKLGTESNGGFRNITISNCTFRQCRGLALEEVDGGVMEDITISNLSMIDIAHYPIYIRLGARNRGPAGTRVGTARNIVISNVIAAGIDRASGIQITGVPGHDIENVRLENIRLIYNGGGTKKDAARNPPELEKGYPEPSNAGVMPSYGLYARHVRGLELLDLSLDFRKKELRPAIACVDVDGLEIDHLKARLAPDVPAGQFKSVRHLTIRNSPVFLDNFTADDGSEMTHASSVGMEKSSDDDMNLAD